MGIKDTPLMVQYKEIKNKHQDSILFFRLGDFYEMFFEDAVLASKELGITLTSRNKEKGEVIPLAGIPYHSSGPYIAKLVNKGYKVAICEQVENPKNAIGIVKREVVRIVTPGTIMDPDYLDAKSNNYIMGIKIDGILVGISYADITTGEFKVSEIEYNSLLGEINKIAPKEIVLDKKSAEILKDIVSKDIFGTKMIITITDEEKGAAEYLKEYFKIISLDSFNLADKELGVKACVLTLKYIKKLQKNNELLISKIEYVSSKNIVELNLTTQRNLEILENTREKTTYGTLFSVLDQCYSSMGSRALKGYLKNPTQDLKEIQERHNNVAFFIEKVLIREEVGASLKKIYDIERILGKIVMGTANGRDLIGLKKSIKASLDIYKLMKDTSIFGIKPEILVEIYNLIEERITEEPPFSIREGGIIKIEYNIDLKDLYKISTMGKDYILEIEGREKESSGIKNLKIKYNRIFGYFIEISNSNKELIPEYYIRKQTLSNAERYIIPELKEYEEKILHAKERIESLEYELFVELCEKIKLYSMELQETGKKIAYIDVMNSFANCAIKNRYVKPEIGSNYSLEIIGGRHPVVETLIGREHFIKNDIFLDEDSNVQILTGPNMSGKSTYMKQGALIILMAHIGSYIPADYGKIPLVDKIFTRIGASDDLLSGQSTFMLEMSEMANIINSATSNSFIILDEIGRGTSTFDGISIATAITEHIHNNINAKTIFATHYHELTQLEKELSKVRNYRIEVKESKDEIVFLRKIVCGGADKSYGIEVARVAGLPQEILKRSKSILNILENQRKIVKDKLNGEQLNLFGEIKELEIKIQSEIEDLSFEREESNKNEKIVIDILKVVNLNDLTPLEALMKINELKNILG